MTQLLAATGETAAAGGIGTVPYIIFSISGVMLIAWFAMQFFAGRGKGGGSDDNDEDTRDT